MQKLRFFLCCVSLLLCGVSCKHCIAESLCSADVSYAWSRFSEDAAIEQVDSKTPKTPKTSPGEELIRVHFTSIERRARDEKTARNLLQSDIQRQKARAMQRCKRAHESFGECVSTKLSTKSTVLNSLSFTARSQLEEALIQECQVSRGICGSVTASEPACVTTGNDEANDSQEAAESKEGEAKSKKGKSKTNSSSNKK